MPTSLRQAMLLATMPVACSIAHAADCPMALKVGMINYAVPPLINDARDGAVADVPGQMITWLREALTRIDCPNQLRILRLPVARAYDYLKRGEIDVWVPGTASTQGLEAGVLPLRGAVGDDRYGFARFRYSFYILKGSTSVQWDGSNLHGPSGFLLGISNATAVQEFAKARNWPAESAPNTNLTIDKLLARRFPVVLVPDQSVLSRPDADQARLERLEPAALNVWFHATFSKQFAASHPQLLRPFWTALCQASRKDQPELPRCPV